MAAAEREASAAVIDFNICADTPLGKNGIRRQQDRAAHRKKSSNNCPGNEPTSYPASQLRLFCICHWSTPVAYAHETVTRFYCTDASLNYSWDYNPNLLDAVPIGKSHGDIIPSMGKARDIPFAWKTSQACDFYAKLRFNMGRFTLYNPDLRHIDYNKINKPTFL
jgi:hypothetical protein